MQAFVAGETDVLVGTTVIEVGVDVPAASVMVILEAERFGLATLHQLRGRVGRGGDKGWCILVSDSDDEVAAARLQAIESTCD
jgi:ATP-dependent DNA helicase RecG